MSPTLGSPPGTLKYSSKPMEEVSLLLPQGPKTNLRSLTKSKPSGERKEEKTISKF